ncbi:DNA-processing protein DprA [Montanilutibacter psychrotolerans]|uniref:DNA-protecting protein DprA n=1 Tax=Montanilutibacter psychrotolerans TaxID=1327343 RepID=A0A3M8ST73_9GAMM|nr:DNA-processing protein DprA [Lysobacter psychrotolerans]RNF84499.1 DNA-protecting protein DprA [Lysobacter psychrotolerans]
MPTEPRDDAIALLHLLFAGGASAPRRRLLDNWQSPLAALSASVTSWRDAGLDDAQIGALRRPPPRSALARALDWLDRESHHVIGWHDADYPPPLREAASPPLALFVSGDPALLWRPSVAVVGSRTPSPGGRDHAIRFAHALSAAGLVVGSGLAAGVDTAAHEATLRQGGHTFAVLGTGPDTAYPATNIGLHARIAGLGALVSEHPPGTPARKEHFPTRNRILAGLSLGTVVIEAAARSGALITARLAAEAGREVFALPGSIDNPHARGCHRLIRDGALLVETPEEIVEVLAPLAGRLAGDLRQRLPAPITGRNDSAAVAFLSGPPGPPVIPPPRGDDYNTLWRALGHDPTDMDELAQRTGLTPAALSSMLLLMELEGHVAARHGRYHRSR